MRNYSNCGSNTEGQSFRCSECEEIHDVVSERMVAGKWRVRDDEVREELVSAIEENTDYDTWVEERVGDVFVYEAPKISIEAGGEIIL